MNRAVLVLVLVFGTLLPADCQQTVDPATREDIERLLQVTGSRENMQQLWGAMAQQAANLAADDFRRQHPSSTPLQQRKAAEAAGTAAQSMMKVFSVDEMFDAIIPIYQRHLSHSDVRVILDFYNSPTGQKMVRQMPQMMQESIQASTAVVRKHMPELQAEAEKAANDSLRESEQ